LEIFAIYILERRWSHPRKIRYSGNKNQREFPPWRTATTASDYAQEETRTSVARSISTKIQPHTAYERRSFYCRLLVLNLPPRTIINWGW